MTPRHISPWLPHPLPRKEHHAQDNGKELARLFAETVEVREPIYEFGSLQVEGQVGYADLRPPFPGRQYVGTDMRLGPGVDRVLDLHALDLPDASVGTALSISTLEHVEFPWRAIAEMHRVLVPGGALVLVSHMNFPIHSHPDDFWRFTPEGFRSLLRAFATVLVEWAGEDLHPHSVVANRDRPARGGTAP